MTARDDAALFVAIRNGDLARATLLLDRGAKPNASDEGYPPLWLAAVRGETKIAQLLIARGARLDGVTPTGQTALAGAVENAKLPVVKLLLAAGARARAPRGRLAEPLLHLAVGTGKLPLVRALVAAGVKDVRYNGRTARQLALLFRRPALAAALAAKR